ncbi:MAG: GbsR/MarR family transcriptional regulator [Alphaproteobacteria bacterium]
MPDPSALSLQEPRDNRCPAPDPLARFIEKVGLFCERDNLPRIAGRVLGFLIVEEGAFSLRELAERLQVSRASVSTNARMLTEIGVAEHVTRPGDRQDYYQLAPNPFHRMLAGRAVVFREVSRLFEDAAAAFPPAREVARGRLKEMAALHRRAADTIAELIERSIKPRH